MIKTPERISLPTVGGERAEVDCNWNSSVSGEYLKLRINGEEAIIPRGSFSRIAMWLASEEEQDAMIPTKTIKIR